MSTMTFFALLFSLRGSGCVQHTFICAFDDGIMGRNRVISEEYVRGLRTDPCGITVFRIQVEEYWLPSYTVQSVVCSLGNLVSI